MVLNVLSKLLTWLFGFLSFCRCAVSQSWRHWWCRCLYAWFEWWWDSFSCCTDFRWWFSLHRLSFLPDAVSAWNVDCCDVLSVHILAKLLRFTCSIQLWTVMLYSLRLVVSLECFFSQYLRDFSDRSGSWTMEILTHDCSSDSAHILDLISVLLYSRINEVCQMMRSWT